MSPAWRHALAVPLVTAALALAGWLLLPTARLDALVEEGALVESATNAGWGLALLALLAWRSRIAPPRLWWPLFIAAAAFAAREADWHKVWTGTSVLKLSWYASAASWPQRLLAGALVLVALAALLDLAWRHVPAGLRAARAGQGWAAALVVFAIVLVVSKVLDRSVAVLGESAGISVDAALAVLVRATEELLELGLPVLLLLALAQRVRRPAPPG